MPALMSNPSSSSSRLHTPSPSPGMSNLTPGPSSSSASTYSLPFRPHGMRAQLAELFHRHAIFAVKLTVHQLWNVPLVSGEFSVKWKFQRLHRVKRPGSANAHGSGGGMLGMSGMNGENLNERMTKMVTPESAAGSLNGIQTVKGKGREVVDVDHDSLTPSGASMLSIPSTSEDSSSPSASTSPRATSVDLPSTDSHQSTKDGEGRGITGDMEEFSQEARGRTPFAPLRDHHVKWGETVKVAVQMGIQRDTLELQPCELKLVIEQLCEPGDPKNAPTNPRLGEVTLNLAEYVDEGPVTRRYLLRQSKVNATLQLTLELTHIGGSDKFKAPPLRKGEVMAGVATLLEKSKKGAGAGRGGPVLVAPGYERTLSRPTIRSHRRATDGGSRSDMPPGVSHEGPGMGSRLHMHTPIPELGIGGLRTTDNIIEAIFNPVPTSSPAPSPFTYYVPTKSRSGLAPTPTPTLNVNINTADRGLSASETGESMSPGPGSAVSGDADVSAGVEDDADLERAPSIARSYSAQSEHSFATSASRSSAVSGSGSGSGSGSFVGETHRQKWWKKITGVTSRPSSPRPTSPVPLPLPLSASASASAPPPPLSAQSGASLRPSADALRVSQSEFEGEHEGEDDDEGLQVRLRDRKYEERTTLAPQIVVRGPTRKSKTVPPSVMSSSDGWRS